MTCRYGVWNKQCNFFTSHMRSIGKVMFLHVCYSVHRGRGVAAEAVCLPGMSWEGRPPSMQTAPPPFQAHPSPGRTPSMQTHPHPGRLPLQADPLRADTPPCIPPPPPPTQYSQPASGTHPTGMYTCIVIFVITQSAIIHHSTKIIAFNFACLLIEIENTLLLKMNSISPIISWLAQAKEFSWYFI